MSRRVIHSGWKSLRKAHYFNFYYITFRFVKRLIFNKSAGKASKTVHITLVCCCIIITRGVMKMLLDCIIRMWLLMPVENGSTWSLFLRILPDCKLVNDVNNELLDVDFICFGGFWHFLKLNGDIQVQLACSCSAGELRVTTRLSLRSICVGSQLRRRRSDQRYYWLVFDS